MGLKKGSVIILVAVFTLGFKSSGQRTSYSNYTVSDLGALIDASGEVVGGASVNIRGDVVGQEILPGRFAFVRRCVMRDHFSYFSRSRKQ